MSNTPEEIKKREWTFECRTGSLADTGDYTSEVIFTNGVDTFQTCGDGLEDDDECQQFCDLLNKMPDLWSYRTDAAEFELSILKRETASQPSPSIPQGESAEEIEQAADELFHKHCFVFHGFNTIMISAYRDSLKEFTRWLLTRKEGGKS
jgi:hypothetical protein